MQDKSKIILRKEMLEARGKITERECKNSLIFEGVKNFVEKFFVKKIFSYVSMQSEVDTKSIISYYISKGEYEIFVPVTKSEMSLHKLLSADKLETDKYGNLPRNQYACESFAGKLDLVIVPLLAFDNELYRLGYGGGFYDKFLEKNEVFTLGLAYDEQEIIKLQHEKHDIPLDAILTPTRLITKEKYGKKESTQFNI